VVFLRSNLEAGRTLTNANLDGYGFHRHQGDGTSEVTAWRMSEGSVEVLAGPKEDNFEGENWRLRWSFTIGPVTPEMPMGYQRVSGEDWVNFTNWGTWDPSGHGGIRPPDAP